MDERTVNIAETTAALAPALCPVCGASNASLDTWCGECGFRLSDALGEAVETGPAWTLSDGTATFRLRAGENVVGRLNAEVFIGDPSVSRRHAVVTVGEGGVTVRDEGSSNGTRVDGEALAAGEERAMAAGSRLEFGSVRMTLVSPEGEAPEPEPAEALAEAAPTASLEGDAGFFPLRPGPNTVGRRAGNAVTIPDAYVSGLHALVTVGDGYATVTDSGSTNGTFVGEDRLAPGEARDLMDGEAVRFGQVSLTFAWLPASAPAPDGEPD